MPSERFYKLKSVKKRMFLKVAYKEFALHSYESASITRLVADLKMAKGSIYQYFNNKQDLYNYLVEHAQNQLESVVDKTCGLPKSNESLEEWLQKLLLIQVKFLVAVPQYASLFIKHQAENGLSKSSGFITLKIKEAAETTGQSITDEKYFYLLSLPNLLFNFIINSEELDLVEIINSDSSMEVATDKLLYLCKAFLQKT